MRKGKPGLNEVTNERKRQRKEGKKRVEEQVKRTRFIAYLICREHFIVVSPFALHFPPRSSPSHTHFAGKEREAQRGRSETVPRAGGPLTSLVTSGRSLDSSGPQLLHL